MAGNRGRNTDLITQIGQEQSGCNASRPEGEQGIMPVDAYPGGSSPYGMFDTVGNVQEWALDYHEVPLR